MARNRAEVVETVRARSGLALEIISGEDEGRLAYLAVATGVGLGDGAIVAFDTGGGSSQFTFGHGSTVDERFSVNVGAVRFTERFGLAEAVSADVVADALAAIAAELARLDGRPRPDAGRGDGRRRDEPRRGEARAGTLRSRTSSRGRSSTGPRSIDRSSATAALDAAGRRAIVGLQPARAEVILAGACIVRTIMDKLDCDAVTVSDHGLRHGVLIERFGSGQPSARRLRG